ncbi:ABC transporter substrate-binding protein [Corynebacterium pacaense]|uniref:ABC transporter substrate-binding protein n=1 Tax=Corynebacterium pacaense TaxID=1816684 RepID=UPI0009BC66E2|nr:ABC transporter substrate-binding protein [Corynebacterium pacaense]
MALSRKQTGVLVGGALAVAVLVAGITTVVVGNDNAEAEAETIVATATGEGTDSFNLTSQNAKDRPRLEVVDEAVDALRSSGFSPIEEGKLTIATTGGAAPLSIFASDDNTTLIGSELDFAQLIADGLDLELNPVPVSWADWPLGVSSGKYDLAVTNVTVTEERLDIFDFATYRVDLLGFYVAADSDIEKIESAEDISGLKIVVGSGTNQEEVLLRWNEELEEQGKQPAELVYYDDQAAGQLALQSGRVDATFGPNATGAFGARNTGDTKLAGVVPGGWPLTANIGATTKKGNGLIEPVALVLQEALNDGAYDEVLQRWGLEEEAVDAIEINPPGLPRK